MKDDEGESKPVYSLTYWIVFLGLQLSIFAIIIYTNNKIGKQVDEINLKIDTTVSHIVKIKSQYEEK